MRVFCAEHELSTASLCKWRRKYEADGEAGLGSRSRPGNPNGRTRRAFSSEERLAAVIAFQRSGLTQAIFSKRWGVSAATLRKWVAVYQSGGGAALQAGMWSAASRTKLTRSMSIARRARSTIHGESGVALGARFPSRRLRGASWSSCSTTCT